MKYIVIENIGPESHLNLVEGPIPPYNDNQLLVSVKAAALNRADIFQRHGTYPPPAGESEIPGLEVAGEIIEVGKKVSQFNIGDRVYGLVGGGGYAQYCIIDESLAHHLPKDWDYYTAAALPESLLTVYGTLYELGHLKPNQTILIHGAGSGISSLAIQMAKISKAKVITTIGQQEKWKKAEELGADEIINYTEQDFQQAIPPNSLDLIIDFVGGGYFNKHLILLKPKGKLIQIATLMGAEVECHLGLIVRKRLKIMGFILRHQTIQEKSYLWAKAHEHFFQFFATDQIKPIVDSVFKIEQLEEAFDRMVQGNYFGKIVVSIE